MADLRALQGGIAEWREKKMGVKMGFTVFGVSIYSGSGKPASTMSE